MRHYLLKLFTLFLLFASINSQSKAGDVWQQVNDSVNQSLEKALPSGSEWEIKTPSFLKSINTKINKIEVNFPSGSLKRNLIVAQVWIQSGGNGEIENNLFAVPIQVNSELKSFELSSLSLPKRAESHIAADLFSSHFIAEL